jgi:uncharacterized membrane protein (DUF373 family)
MPDDKAPLTSVKYSVAGLLGTMETAIYLLVSVFLLAMTLLMLYQVGKDMTGFSFMTTTTGNIMPALQDLMTTFILAELIQTVAVFLKSRMIDVRLILAAGLTAMIRRILVSGVEEMSTPDMAVTAVLMLVLIVAIFLAGERKINVRSHS